MQSLDRFWEKTSSPCDMARGRSGGRSSAAGAVYMRNLGASSDYVGSKDKVGTLEENLMSLPLTIRCRRLSIVLAKFMQDESKLCLADDAKKLMVGCPERYFDYKTVAARYLDTSYKYNGGTLEENLMSLPLTIRCRRLSIMLAQFMQDDSKLCLAEDTKKLMVGCPERYFDYKTVAARYLHTK